MFLSFPFLIFSSPLSPYSGSFSSLRVRSNTSNTIFSCFKSKLSSVLKNSALLIWKEGERSPYHILKGHKCFNEILSKMLEE